MSTSRRVSAIISVSLLAVLSVAFLPQLIGAAQLELPEGVDRDLAYRMYTEQVDSSDNVERLVAGEFKSIKVERREVTTPTATLHVTFTDKEDIEYRGVMVLDRGGDKWYFRTITSVVDFENGEALEDSPLVEAPDTGVLNTILKEQTENYGALIKMVDGTYTEIKLSKPKAGFRSVTIPVTFEGPSAKKAKGEVTCIQRTEQGRDIWFVASFANKK